MSPCFHRMMPVGIVSPAAKTVAESGRPSESVSASYLTVPAAVSVSRG